MKFWHVDSFTDEIFKGNPAAVFVLREALSDDTQQKIAQEMNLSETVFVLLGEKQNTIRWFTPNVEVDLCGHATLAAAHILWEQNFISGASTSFQSLSGILGVSRDGDRYTLDFPLQPPIEKPEYREKITAILCAAPLYVGSNGGDCVAVVESSDFVRSFKPDLEQIRGLAERGLLLTAQDHSGACDYIYRAFFPKLNIPEDPVTGSANTALGPYWAKLLGRQKLSAYQASQRGGSLQVEVTPQRVLISGQAVTVYDGNFRLNR